MMKNFVAVLSAITIAACFMFSSVGCGDKPKTTPPPPVVKDKAPPAAATDKDKTPPPATTDKDKTPPPAADKKVEDKKADK